MLSGGIWVGEVDLVRLIVCLSYPCMIEERSHYEYFLAISVPAVFFLY